MNDLVMSPAPRHRRRRPDGFTLIELLVVIAIIALLVSLLMPSLNRAKELARQAVCASSLNNIGRGIAQYGNEYDDRLPLWWTHNANAPSHAFSTLVAYWGGGSWYIIDGVIPSFNLAILDVDGFVGWQSFYCPSQKDPGWRLDCPWPTRDYVGTWTTPPAQRKQLNLFTATSYMYNPYRGPSVGGAAQMLHQRLETLPSDATLSIDVLGYQSATAHSFAPGWNRLTGGFSVEFVVDGYVYESLPPYYEGLLSSAMWSLFESTLETIEGG